MKSILILFLVLISLSISAQQEAPPQGINYQAVLYSDNSNNGSSQNQYGMYQQVQASQPGLNPLSPFIQFQDIGVQFSILSGSSSGTVIYKEVHLTTTDEFGMFDLIIGQGLVQGTQSFNMIDWGAGYHFLKVEVDNAGGTNYVEISNQQLWSVPYALYSGYSSSSGYADSSAYTDIAGNGLTGVSDNGDGTLTFTYYDGSTYTTSVLSGLGGVGPQGPAGTDGQDGLSAYEVWLAQGNTGTESDFLNSLEGPQGPAGTNGVDGVDGANGVAGQDGQSAYEIWLAQGNTGTEQDFLNSLQANSNENLQIGDYSNGGLVFYIDSTGQHGKVMTPFDVMNYNMNSDQNMAITVCNNLTANGFSDWYLPEVDDLQMIHDNLGNGGFGLSWAWSSSTAYTVWHYWSATTADPSQWTNAGWSINFENGNQVVTGKNNDCRIRAVRNF